jgi:hypothetical protein
VETGSTAAAAAADTARRLGFPLHQEQVTPLLLVAAVLGQQMVLAPVVVIQYLALLLLMAEAVAGVMIPMVPVLGQMAVMVVVVVAGVLMEPLVGFQAVPVELAQPVKEITVETAGLVMLFLKAQVVAVAVLTP